jgi:two-component system nitrogen regulation response regulator GlnG
VQSQALRLLIERGAAQSRLTEQADRLQRELGYRGHLGEMTGTSKKMQEVFTLIQQVAPSRAAVLITGESGTGKELAARAIHALSPRAAAPFVAINCAAMPDTLMGSELFGHEKGAFTGAAAQRVGKFEQCDHGTIFLDEIGDMSLATQTKILRVLQSGEFERVGGNQTVKVDVRVIAATNKPLEQAVSDREFREDLFYRLNVVRVQLPPLRERRGDVRLLVSYFLQKFAKLQKQPIKAIQSEVLDQLEQHSWPGNVRELENCIQRALVVAKGGTILCSDLPADIAGPGPTVATVAMASAHSPSAAVPPANKATDISDLARQMFDWARASTELKLIPAVERELIINALVETKGNQVRAAKLLGITRATLRKRMEKFKIRQELSIT